MYASVSTLTFAGNPLEEFDGVFKRWQSETASRPCDTSDWLTQFGLQGRNNALNPFLGPNAFSKYSAWLVRGMLTENQKQCSSSVP